MVGNWNVVPFKVMTFKGLMVKDYLGHGHSEFINAFYTTCKMKRR